jgi:hypothetical protein
MTGTRALQKKQPSPAAKILFGGPTEAHSGLQGRRWRCLQKMGWKTSGSKRPIFQGFQTTMGFL